MEAQKETKEKALLRKERREGGGVGVGKERTPLTAMEFVKRREEEIAE